MARQRPARVNATFAAMALMAVQAVGPSAVATPNDAAARAVDLVQAVRDEVLGDPAEVRAPAGVEVRLPGKPELSTEKPAVSVERDKPVAPAKPESPGKPAIETPPPVQPELPVQDEAPSGGEAPGEDEDSAGGDEIWTKPESSKNPPTMPVTPERPAPSFPVDVKPERPGKSQPTEAPRRPELPAVEPVEPSEDPPPGGPKQPQPPVKPQAPKRPELPVVEPGKPKQGSAPQSVPDRPMDVTPEAPSKDYSPVVVPLPVVEVPVARPMNPGRPESREFEPKPPTVDPDTSTVPFHPELPLTEPGQAEESRSPGVANPPASTPQVPSKPRPTTQSPDWGQDSPALPAPESGARRSEPVHSRPNFGVPDGLAESPESSGPSDPAKSGPLETVERSRSVPRSHFPVPFDFSVFEKHVDHPPSSLPVDATTVGWTAAESEPATADHPSFAGRVGAESRSGGGPAVSSEQRGTLPRSALSGPPWSSRGAIGGERSVGILALVVVLAFGAFVLRLTRRSHSKGGESEVSSAG